MRPIARPLHQSGVDRGRRDHMHMPIMIVLIPDHMFPETALPDTLFTPLCPAWRDVVRHRTMARKRRFDHPPPGCISLIIWRQGPDHMHGAGQNDRSVNPKRSPFHAKAGRIAQQTNPADQQVRHRILQANGKEIRASRHKTRGIIQHGPNMRLAWLRHRKRPR